jgi:hypothetical protein
MLISTRDPGFLDLQCMSYTSKGTHELLVAGNQNTMFKIDVDKGEITQTVCLLDALPCRVLTGPVASRRSIQHDAQKC